jgi:hypothetical protein
LELTPAQQKQLDDILDSGPAAYGLDTGMWTSPMIAWVIEEEFGIQYHRAMCASCSIVWASPCSAHVACWPGLTLTSEIAGSGTATPASRKNAAKKLGVDLHRRSQLSPRIYPARHP